MTFYDILTFFIKETIEEKANFLHNLLGEQIVDNHLKHVDELYGSGDLDEKLTVAEEVDQHISSSIEGLARLYRKENDFLRKLKNLQTRTYNHLKAPTYPKSNDEIREALVGNCFIKTKSNKSICIYLFKFCRSLQNSINIQYHI